jgi:site-specific recombinase XerD
MEQFKEYLQQRSFRESTINGHLQNVGYFMQWLQINGLYEVENITYNDLLNYVQHEKEKQIETVTLNLRLTSVSKYFEFLKEENLITRNPARTLRIKGSLKKVIEQPLKYADLEKLYNHYKVLQKSLSADWWKVPNHIKEKSELAHQRNIVIVGLLIWQGLHSGELEKLEVNHINLNDGTIYIPSTARSNSRTLKLSTQQILTLHTYIHGGTRDKLKPKAEELLPGHVHNIINLLTQELKGINLQIKNALHIRASVILHWLRQHNKRQVQYMAGHKYIHSTEAYEVQELETLTDQLTKHHPFG